MSASHGELFRRTATIAVAVAVVVLVAGIIVLGAQLLLLLFGALLLAVFLTGLSRKLCEHTSLGPRMALLAVTLGVGAVLGVGGWLLAPSVIEQAEEFVDSLPGFLDEARELISSVLGGDQLLRQIGAASQNGALVERATDVLEISARGIYGIAVIVIAGLYFAVDLDLYERGLLRLLPVTTRSRAAEIIAEMAHTLRLFLLARLVSMFAVGVITAFGLMLLDIRLAAMLGVVAGTLTFVPYAGPIAASIPIALVAATEGIGTLAYVLSMYTAVQMLEGFFITPIVQQRAVHLPPVITLAAEILMGTIFGVLGIVISVPLAAASLVFVRLVYVEDLLEAPTTKLQTP